MNKKTALLLILVLAASSIILAKPACAQTSKPSVPQFTVKYVDYSYNIAPTYGTDPYSGQTVMQTYGDHIDNRTIQVTITNQPYSSTDGSYLYYNVRVKGQFGEDWNEICGVDGLQMNPAAGPDANNYRIQDSSSQYTVIRYQLAWNVPTQGQMDVQVEALAGFPIVNVDSDRSHIFYAFYIYSFNGTSSGWSNTQTVSFTQGATGTTPTPTPTATTNSTQTTNQTATLNPTEKPAATPVNDLSYATNFESSLLTVIVSAIAVVFIVVTIALLLYIKRLKTKQAAV